MNLDNFVATDARVNPADPAAHNARVNTDDPITVPNDMKSDKIPIVS